MKRSAKIATALAAGAAITVGGILAAGPVTAAASGGAGSPARVTTQSRMMDTQQYAHRYGGPGGAGTGMCSAAVTAASGTLTTAQKATLARMAEEEKLAHDLYTAFAAQYGDDTPVFTRIAAAETRHLEAVRTLLDRYGIDDPTSGQAAGAFGNASIQATYDRLFAQGSTSLTAALKAGRTVEVTDISDLTKALSGLKAPDVQQVYDNLLAASRTHQAAFNRWLGQ
ncbi:DUF2202 domain-containing protein [Streptomyces sp. NBC_01262]|uniref:DUF2202 domain-containing protein n=1 Tax=Streptomyces sp. NBC_01262 TaxID=2903803 RepID=UPI002E32ABDD|nr:DUF2202 domain-containing protein [Streptomyces sp. NBC_01262]